VLGSQYRPAVNTWARLSLVFAVIFAALAVMSRILQFVFLAGQGDPHLLDLYTARSLAQYAEFLAFGPFFGGALLFASRMFPSSGVDRWARRLFALSGLLTFIGGSIFILLSLAGPSFSLSPQVGLLISLPAWVILYPAAIGLTAWLLWPGRATAQIGRARATWG
jgi:hypothetical protein